MGGPKIEHRQCCRSPWQRHHVTYRETVAGDNDLRQSGESEGAIVSGPAKTVMLFDCNKAVQYIWA